MKFQPYIVEMDNYKAIQDICPLNEYITCDPKIIPVDLPSSLLDKCVHAVIVGSGDYYNAVYMVNFLRADTRSYAIDQQPLIIACHNESSGIDLTAGFIHHGSWKGRTVYPGEGFFQAIEGSGITQYYPFIGVPIKPQGHISELTPDSHKQAFWNGVQIIKTA